MRGKQMSFLRTGVGKLLKSSLTYLVRIMMYRAPVFSSLAVAVQILSASFNMKYFTMLHSTITYSSREEGVYIPISGDLRAY